MKEIKGSLKKKKKQRRRNLAGRAEADVELVKKKIYFEPFQKAGAADTQRPAQTESSCVSGSKCLGLPPTRSRGGSMSGLIPSNQTPGTG